LTIAAAAAKLLKYNNMCACSGSCNCEEIITLPTGVAGTDGDQGLFGGFSLGWKFNTSTSTSPASTTLRFNSTTYNLVSTLYINDTNTDSVDSAAFLDAFTNSSNYGLIKIFKVDDSSKFWMGTITGNTDSGTYHTISVTYISHNGAFAADDELVVSFVPKGATGSTGATGASGASYFSYDANNYSHTGGGGSETLTTISLPSNTLSSNGQALKIELDGTTAATANSKAIVVSFAGTTIATNSTTTAPNNKNFKILVSVRRSSNTVVHCSTSIVFDGIAAQTSYAAVTALTLSTTSYNFKVDVTSSDVNGVVIVDSLSYKIY